MASESPELFTTPSGSSPTAAHTTPTEMVAWNKTDAFYLNSANSYQDYEVPNWHMTTWVEQFYTGQLAIHVYTYDMWWVFVTNQESLKWYNETTGLELSEPFASIQIMPIWRIEAAYDSDFNLNYRLTNTRGSLHITLGWNTTAYAGNLTAAYYGDGIHFNLSQDFSDRVTSLNLIDILSGLFLGSIFGANTLGIDPLYSAIITITLDASAVYMIATIVRSFIPFLGQD